MAIRPVTRAGVGLVIGIIILAALVFAGLWFVRERSETAQREEAINIAEEQLKQESDKEVAIETDKDKEEKTETETAAPIPQSGNAHTSQTPGASELPQTGPAELGSLIGLGALGFAVTSFIRSRKLVSSQL